MPWHSSHARSLTHQTTRFLFKFLCRFCLFTRCLHAQSYCTSKIAVFLWRQWTFSSSRALFGVCSISNAVLPLKNLLLLLHFKVLFLHKFSQANKAEKWIILLHLLHLLRRLYVTFFGVCGIEILLQFFCTVLMIGCGLIENKFEGGI